MLETRHQLIIHDIIKKYPHQFYVFGSRAKNTHKPYSDLDLCFKENIPEKDLANLILEFAESDLPFKVDLINWYHCSEEFQNLIKNDLTPLEKILTDTNTSSSKK